ncbi:hypothetical protein [Nocardia callitridis]|uniref:Methionine synthase n=1 Tax=Nocardia callitridis TaxID=648753 RepID=A0ABP9KK36_9NOCA
MTRHAHYVGSLPGEIISGGDLAVMRWFVENSAGKPITAIPCDLDPDWLVVYLRERAQHADVFEAHKPGDYTGYGDFPDNRVRRGQTLRPQHVSMNRVERIGRVVENFTKLRAEHPELADTKLQVGLPNPLDVSMFVFAGRAVSGGLPVGRAFAHANLVVRALRHLPVFVEAAITEVTEIQRRYGDLVVWQLESPFALLAMVKATQLRSRWALGPLVAQQFAGLLTRMHETGAETVVHLCYGDLAHESLLTPSTLAPAVNLLDRAARLLRQSKVPLPPVHIPCAYGPESAPLRPEFYTPLGKLDPDWQLIAGVVSPESADDSARALTLFERAAHRTSYGVATACGLGRGTVEAAKQAAATMVELTEAAPA